VTASIFKRTLEDDLVKLFFILSFQFNVAFLDGSPDALADPFGLPTLLLEFLQGNPESLESSVDFFKGDNLTLLPPGVSSTVALRAGTRTEVYFGFSDLLARSSGLLARSFGLLARSFSILARGS